MTFEEHMQDALKALDNKIVLVERPRHGWTERWLYTECEPVEQKPGSAHVWTKSRAVH
jgi:hypothetical protein